MGAHLPHKAQHQQICTEKDNDNVIHVEKSIITEN